MTKTRPVAERAPSGFAGGSGASSARKWLGGAHAAAWALLCLVASTPPLRAEIIDRIVVSVGNRAITASALEREIRVTAFLNGKRPDFSPAARRATAERMVEQQLIRGDLENSRFPSASPDDVQPTLEKFKAAFYPEAAEYERALTAAGVSAQDVIDALLWQRNLLDFTDMRFRLGVQVSEQDIKDYFDKVVKPAAEAAHPGAPAELADYRATIEETLAGARVDRDLDEWLKRARSRTDIVFHDEALQ